MTKGIYEDSTRSLDGEPEKSPLPRAAHFDAGERLGGRYRVVRLIASGGMGDVYEVEDEQLGGRVALKTVRAALAGDDAAADRFRREVHLARRVTHPNVCRVFDVGADRRGVTFYTMELLAGETLAQRLARSGPLAPGDALAVARQIAAGIEAVHAADVLHRDLKSANVHLVPDEREPIGVRALLTDFGLARELGGGASASGTILGTADYMAPEQARGEPLTRSADLYAFGVVLFEMVTGRRPFDGDTALGRVAQKLRRSAPSPRRFAKALDHRWDSVILRCLERDPARRFARPSDVTRALAGERVPAPRGWSRRLLIATVTAAAIGAGGAAAWRRAHPPRGPRDPEVARLYAGGTAALRRHDAPAAAPLLERAAAIAPEDPLVEAALADAWRALGRDQPALEAARRSFEHAASLPREERLAIEARLRELNGERDEAVRLYRALFGFFPGRAEYGLALAEAETAAGHARDALTTVAALRRTASPDPEIDVVEAQAQQALGDFHAERAAAGRAADEAGRLNAPLLRARALLSQGWAALNLGDPAAAVAAFEEARALYKSGGDRAGAARALLDLGIVRANAGDVNEARRVIEAALVESRAIGDRRSELRELLALGNVLDVDATRPLATERYGAALAIAREIGDRVAVASLLHNLAVTLMSVDHAAADQRFQEAVAAYRDIGDDAGVASSLSNRAQLSWLVGDPDGSKELYQEALALCHKTGNRRDTAFAEFGLGLVLADQDDLTGARKMLEDSIAVRRQLGQAMLAGDEEWYLARVLGQHGHAAEAEAAARDSVELLHAADVSNESVAHSVLAWLLAARGARRQATAELAAARKNWSDLFFALKVEVERADVALARGGPACAATRQRLDALAAEEGRLHNLPARLELDEQRAELDRACGRPAAARAGFSAVAREAREHGLARLAREASHRL